ncbi:hypothetical protein JTB14_023882 [Gonioctena quinquepunctata]|nr:hypothetical protein JTB14_023882 [Gonioctena quinquepunctata]
MSKRPITRSAKILIKSQEPSDFNPPHSSSTVDNPGISPFEKSSRISRSPPAPLSPIQEQDFLLPQVIQRKKILQEEPTLDEFQLSDTDSEDTQENPKEETIVDTQQQERNPTEEGKQPNTPVLVPRVIPVNTNPTIMANTTINDALLAEKTPSIPDFISPATYNPCKGNANSFIKGYNRTAIANGWDEKLKICYFGSFLEGAANIWYTIYTNLAANNTKTWSDISEDFIKEFGDQDVKKVLKCAYYRGNRVNMNPSRLISMT